MAVAITWSLSVPPVSSNCTPVAPAEGTASSFWVPDTVAPFDGSTTEVAERHRSDDLDRSGAARADAPFPSSPTELSPQQSTPPNVRTAQ